MHAHELEIVDDLSLPLMPQGAAHVRSQTDQGNAWVLEVDGREFDAGRAASCLLEPMPGDRVWFVRSGGECWMTAILERASDGPPTIAFDGDAALQVQGELTLSARALELRAKEHVGVTGDELRVQSRLARVVFDECTAVLRSLFSHVTRSTLVARCMEILSDRFTLSSKTSFRSVEGVDQVDAGVIDYRAKEVAHVAADTVLVNGGQIAKVEAGQIHLG